MLKRIAILSLALGLLTQCSGNRKPEQLPIIATEKAEVGEAELSIALGKKAFQLILKNTSDEDIVVDKKLEYMVEMVLYDIYGNKLTPSISPANTIVDDETRGSFAQRMVVLKPGQSVIRTIREGDTIYDYEYHHGREGASSISRYCYTCPPVHQIARIRLEYGEMIWNAPIVDVKASLYDYPMPDNFFRGTISLHPRWARPGEKR